VWFDNHWKEDGLVLFLSANFRTPVSRQPVATRPEINLRTGVAGRDNVRDVMGPSSIGASAHG